jgi:hypothetical protein
MTTNAGGLVERVAIYHRPLDALLRFSAEMEYGLAEVMGRDRFHNPEQSWAEPTAPLKASRRRRIKWRAP